MNKNNQKTKNNSTKKRTKTARKSAVVKRNVTRKVLARNFLVALFLIVILLSFSYFLLNKSLEKSVVIDTPKVLQDKKEYSNDEVMNEILETKGLKDDVLLFEKSLQIKEQKEQNLYEEPIIETQEEIIEKKDIRKSDDKGIVTKKDKFIPSKNSKAKIVIVIDDVVSQTHINKILDIGYPITMSFLPPTPMHINSAKIASKLDFYMIHFPLQASSAFKSVEIKTLNIDDTYKKIESRVKELRKIFPNAIYTNNHTGSVFTENYEAMDRLFRALKKYNFIFVDSKTSPNSVAKELSVKYKMPYIVRDTFLDNERDFTKIQNQLKEAIKIAKKQGFAIAIGHPYDVTFKVLKESKYLFEDVEPIFLNQLPYL